MREMNKVVVVEVIEVVRDGETTSVNFVMKRKKDKI